MVPWGLQPTSCAVLLYALCFMLWRCRLWGTTVAKRGNDLQGALRGRTGPQQRHPRRFYKQLRGWRASKYGLDIAKGHIVDVEVEPLAMAQEDVVSLRTTQSVAAPDRGEPVARTSNGQSAGADLEQITPSNAESNWNKTCVLIGSAILQLPMWGRG